MNNRKAMQLSFMYHNKVVLMQMRPSHLGFIVVTDCREELYKSNQN